MRSPLTRRRAPEYPVDERIALLTDSELQSLLFVSFKAKEDAMQGGSTNDEDFAYFKTVFGSPGIGVLNASFSRHRFAPHMHDEWAIAGVISGAKDNGVGRDMNIVRAGELSVTRPGQAHAGMVVGTAPCHYAMVYVSDDQLRKRAVELGIGDLVLPSVAIENRGLASRLSHFVMQAFDITDEVALQHTWLLILDEFLLSHTVSVDGDVDGDASISRLDRARTFLAQHWNQPVSLATLAGISALSPHHFCRRFSREYGLSPHRYQLTLRLTRARSMIAQGVSLADVAHETGFSDQSHLGRLFKSSFGYAPGHLRPAPSPSFEQ